MNFGVFQASQMVKIGLKTVRKAALKKTVSKESFSTFLVCMFESGKKLLFIVTTRLILFLKLLYLKSPKTYNTKPEWRILLNYWM